MISQFRDGELCGVESLPHRPGQRFESLHVGNRCRQRPRHRGVHVGGRHTEPLGFGCEVATYLARVQVALGEQVTHAGQGQRPPVGAGAQEFLQESQRGGGLVDLALDPALDRRDVRVAHLGERSGHLEVGIQARHDDPEQLQDRLLAEDDRRVRLLAPENEAARIAIDHRTRLASEDDAAA